MRKPKDYILIFAKGLCMGATEVVQGVSGSTMALILGVYQEFITCLKSVNRESVRVLFEGRLAAFWKIINGNFLVAILAGISVSLLLITPMISQLLQRNFIVTTSFLFGLILVSGMLVLRRVTKWNLASFLALSVGFGFNYLLTVTPSYPSLDSFVFVFLAGVIAGFSIVIPGLSSAFILMLVGKYHLIVVSFDTLNAAVIAVFLAGALIGLWMASRFIYRILGLYYNPTLALLAGLMLGALNKLWPWRNAFEFVTNSRGDQIPAYDESILPWKYYAVTGNDPQILQAILVMALGALTVIITEKITAGLKTKM